MNTKLNLNFPLFSEEEQARMKSVFSEHIKNLSKTRLFKHLPNNEK